MKVCERTKNYKKMSKSELIKALKEIEERKIEIDVSDKMERTIHELKVHQIELEMQNRELREAQMELELSRNRYSHLYDFAPCGYITLDEKGNIKEMNMTCAEMLGIDRKRFEGMTFIRFINTEDMNKFISCLERCRKTDKKVMEEISVRKGGKILPLELIMTICKKDGISYNISLTDISERKKSEEYEKKLQEERHLGQKLRALGRLSGGIAHEFNNILGIILGYAEMTMSEISLDNPLNEYVIQIIEACLRAKDIVKQILIFSQKDKGQRKPLKISHIIKEGIELLKPLLPANIKLYKDFKDNESIISGDKTCIHQILINLCINSIYSISGKNGEITIRLRDIDIDEKNMDLYTELKPGPYVKLTVSDTGQGMDGSTIKHIFEPYFTTKERGRGSGMGLSVVHGIVKNHNGDIKAYSEKDKGATFDILFPRLMDKTCEEEIEEKEIIPVDNKSKRILFIDDEQSLVEIGRLSLKKIGYNVFATKSCEEALKIFSEEPFSFDLVITDQTMPEMSGLELIRKLRDIRMDIPVILCTGHSDYINEENAHLRGIRKLIMKPFTLKDLSESVQSIISEEIS